MKMKVLVVGSGGREHALVKALKNSPQVEALWCWPGNDGIFLDANQVPVKNGDLLALTKWAEQNEMGLVVIGPEAELVAGLSNALRTSRCVVFGPSKEAAQLEGSKIFAKQFMREFNIPTARAETVMSVGETLIAASQFQPPYVLKADGLAAGKGVFICADLAELEAAANDIFEEKKLGAAGERALLEEFQPGQELSVLALTNGTDFEVLPLCRDHKRLLDGDKGPNTGGMGVVGPIEIDEDLRAQIVEKVLQPTVQGLKKRGALYRGVIFIGIMVTAKGPQVLEYNVRFGDPETQVILPLLEGDWASALWQVAFGKMPKLVWRDASAACLVLAAEGYPDNPVKGVEIQGLDSASDGQTMVLHAGTKLEGENFVTNGGRVLNVVAMASSLEEALRLAYRRAGSIQWSGRQMRKDIGRTSS